MQKAYQEQKVAMRCASLSMPKIPKPLLYQKSSNTVWTALRSYPSPIMVEPMKTSSLNTYEFWSVCSISSSILLVHYAPVNLSVCHSVPLTAGALFLSWWLIYGIYAVVLYPRYLSPLRHLPTPKVRGTPKVSHVHHCVITFRPGQLFLWRPYEADIC